MTDCCPSSPGGRPRLDSISYPLSISDGSSAILSILVINPYRQLLTVIEILSLPSTVWESTYTLKPPPKDDESFPTRGVESSFVCLFCTGGWGGVNKRNDISPF